MTNEEKPPDSLIVERESVIGKDSAAVWKLLTDISSWGRWNPVIDHATVYGPFQPGTQFKCTSGKWEFDSRILEIEPQHRLALHGATFGLRLTLSWELSPQDSGTLVRAAASISGWMALLLRNKLRESVDESLSAWLSSLKTQCEKGGPQVDIAKEMGRPVRAATSKTGYAFPFSFMFGPIGGRKRNRSGG